MRKIGILLVLLIGIFSCNNRKADSLDKPVITVSILPQKYFIEKIVGDNFAINVMIPPGASPVTYEPTPKQMKDISKSDLYIRIGHIEFEKAWMKNIKDLNSEMDIIDQSKNSELIKTDQRIKHGDHYHYGVDPHIWTSPREVKKQVQFIYEYLSEEYPDLKSEFTENYKVFIGEVDALDAYLSENLKPLKDKKFLIFHPALAYIARDYGLEQISIEIDGKEPTPANIQEIVKVTKNEQIKIVFVQQQFSTHNAEVIAKEIGGKVVQINPLAFNWYDGVKHITDEIVKSYSYE